MWLVKSRVWHDGIRFGSPTLAIVFTFFYGTWPKMKCPPPHYQLFSRPPHSPPAALFGSTNPSRLEGFILSPPSLLQYCRWLSLLTQSRDRQPQSFYEQLGLILCFWFQSVTDFVWLVFPAGDPNWLINKIQVNNVLSSIREGPYPSS